MFGVKSSTWSLEQKLSLQLFSRLRVVTVKQNTWCQNKAYVFFSFLFFGFVLVINHYCGLDFFNFKTFFFFFENPILKLLNLPVL